MENPNPLEVVAIGAGAGLLYWWFRSGSNGQRTVVIKNYKECEAAVEILREHCKENPVLGFDCEWVWGSDRVDLLQLCTHKGYCALIRLCAMRTLPPSLGELLDDSHIVKVGVDPLNDAGRLSKQYTNLTPISILDLRFVAVLTREKPGTLAAMYKSVVGGTLDKCWQLSASNWRAKYLTQEQIDYAAGDAIAGIQIYTTLAQKVSHVSVFQQYYDQRYNSYYHDALEPIATNTCSLQ
ncbi:exonuclease 3'-5' domain-containing protein 2-like [Anastrepha obliqua]|uniref:exonuclease 3'-5' domain-containing protein 2-like n=1 Tax=Anastrepha obliqua TaxID=95512 RepID=UPI00240A4377|nr:exonuclease 3'-5' domain-containing protein 2-like [Anastrepha obliqua]XP_054740091.1 exonuclease 3'-5' domain-containing protein 2-like [Anastrepha obliqua]